MSNNKQSSVEWQHMELIRINYQYAINKITPRQFQEQTKQTLEQAKAMHKDEIINAINEVSENNVKYANMIIASWSQMKGEIFIHNTKLAEQYYNATFESNDGKALDN